MGSRRRGKARQGAFDRPDYTPEEAANLLYGDISALEKIDRQRVIVRPVSVGEITLYPEIQVRVGGLDPETVEKYVQILLNGGEFSDPIIVYLDEERGELILSAGYHRYESTIQALERADDPQSIKPLKAEIRPGGYEAAYDYAEEDNLQHGKALSNADKQYIFERRLRRGHAWATSSEREIARQLGVSHPTIAAWRRSLTGKFLPVEPGGEISSTGKFFPVEEKTRGADGKFRDTSGIRKSNQRRAQTTPKREKPAKPSIHYKTDLDADPGYEEPYVDYGDEDSAPLDGPNIPEHEQPYAKPKTNPVYVQANLAHVAVLLHGLPTTADAWQGIAPTVLHELALQVWNVGNMLHSIADGLDQAERGGA